MTRYILKRILLSLFLILMITVLNFAIIYKAPGTPMDYLSNPRVTEAALDDKAEQFGLKRPLHVQYLDWLNNVLHGKLGKSYMTHEPVNEILKVRLVNSFYLMGAALLVGIVFSLILGAIAAFHRNRFLDRWISLSSLLKISVPNFFLALLLVYFLAIRLKWLPSGGMSTAGVDNTLGDTLKHLVMPCLVLASNVVGRNARFVRSALLDVMDKDYIITAQMKGIGYKRAVLKHGLKNAMLPIITSLGLEIPLIFSGAIITESVFQWPGIGLLLMNAISRRDYPVIMGMSLAAAIAVVLTHFLIDMLYLWVDKRIAYED